MHQSKSALHSNLQSDLETTLEWGKWTQLEGPINNLRERVYEGKFFHLKPNNNIPTFLTIYRPEKTSYRWTLKGKYYMTQEDVRQNRQRPI
jgi:hypothetical protein